MPRRQRSRATVCAQGEPSTQRRPSGPRALSRRTSRASIAPIPSSRTDWATGSAKLDARQPVEVALGPVVALEAQVVAQQQLGDAVAGSHQVAANVLAGAHQVAHRLLGRAWAPGPRAAPPIISSRTSRSASRRSVLTRSCAGRSILPGAATTQRCRCLQRSRQAEAGRACLVADRHRRRQLGAELRHLARHTPQALHSQLARLGVDDRGDHLRRVDIQTQPTS